MGGKRLTADEIAGKLREADALLAKGQTIAQARKAIGATEQSATAGSAPGLDPTSGRRAA